MTENLEHAWVKEIFTPDELKQYAEFEKTMKANSTQEEFKKQWRQLLDELKQNLTEQPDSKKGIQLGEKYMAWVNKLYGKKYAHLRTKKWEKGFGEGKGLDEIGMSPEIISWLEKAMDAYWRDRLYRILDQVGKSSDASVLGLWNEALDDMYGEEDSRKQALYEVALKDDKISEKAKAWLRRVSGAE